MNKAKWLAILNQANFDIIDEVKDGEILEVVVNSNNKEVTLSVCLPKLVSLRLIEKIAAHVNPFLQETLGVETINYLWSYKNKQFSSNLIEEYYRKAITLAQKNRKLAGVLKEYKYQVNDDRIIVMVATPTDQGLASEALHIVRDFFNAHGLNHIELDTCISQSETCIRDIVENEINIRKELRDARSYEQQKQQIKMMNSYEEKVVYKPKRASTAVQLRLKELPITSMEAVEFRQKNSTDQVVVEGVLFKAECRKVKGYTIFEGFITDYEDSILIKRFYKPQEQKFFEEELKPGIRIRVQGNLQYDNFAKDNVIMAQMITKLGEDATHIRFDEAKEKRVELHAHTKMSTLDSVLDVDKYVEAAAKFGHKAVAVTDHANCHVLPAFFNACKTHKIKPIAGVEGNFIDDSRLSVTLTQERIELLDATFVIFDIETTGFSVNFNEIIEIGAIKMKNGIQLDSFSTFVRPSRKISKMITDLTSITNDDVAKAPTIEEVLPKFVDFIGDAILVAHNATFDTGFIYRAMKQQGLYHHDFPCIDTLQLARVLYNERIKRFNLEAVAKELKVEIVDHHRAISDAKTTSHIFMKMLGDLTDHHVYNYGDINAMVDQDLIYKYIIPSHINILVKNKQGLKNFYHIISDSHTNHFYKEPRVLKSIIDRYREGILVGSGCANGEIFTYAYEKSYEELLERARYYDYLEVQPPECYAHLSEKYGEPETAEFIKTTLKTIIKAGKELNIPVIATGDIHQLESDETVYRKIFIRVPRPGGGLHEMFGVENVPNMYFRTTSEMLEAFAFLAPEDAYRIVVTETQKIADLVEEMELFPKQLFTPNDDFMARYGTPSMAEAVRNLTYNRAISLYGVTNEDGEVTLPPFIEERIKQELDSIIGNGYASIYYISHILVKNSVENGYIVGSRGSVGSSFVATMMDITEVNPLKPHYVCPKCRFSIFKGENGDNEKRLKELPVDVQEAFNQVTTGQDLPDCHCPRCQTKLNRDGVDIPFETFLGIKGKDAKVPDIDLNFSGEYQERAHLFCRDIFGIDNAFRGGTIGTVAEKTAYGFVKGYLEDTGKLARSAEIDRLSQALIGSKRTTGQHPGGIILIPNTIEYADIIPIQYPADDPNSTWRTSHYDYHSFEKNLLKMDILGHDDPTMIKHLMDFVHQYPDMFPFSTVEEIPILDKDVIALFSTKEVLGLRGHDEDMFPSGTIGIPEFGTNFVRAMLKDVQPKNFSDIVKISGLSHGNDVWAGNLKELVLGLDENFPQIPFQDVIACRDDIMLYLINKGISPLDAFLIMERVRKGKGLRPEDVRLMHQHQVPDWYIESCQKIKYMFPKAHAVAYVIMALRIAWFKVHRPIYYYAAYFSRRASAFDVEVFASGKNAIRNKLQSIGDKINNRTASNKEVALYDELQIALEMVLRGFTFHQVNIFKSDATNFVLTEDHQGLIMPYIAVDALGKAAAESIVEARNQRPFSSMRDVLERTKINKTIFNRLKVLGTFEGLPDEEHRTLFENSK